MPWVWRTRALENPSGVYHLVWSRDLYQIATALLAAGDRAGAGRALDFLFDRAAEARRLLPAELDRRRHPSTGRTCSSTRSRFPIVLAWQLGRRDAKTFAARQARGRLHPRPTGRRPPQERWENQSGWSPATIASEIAGLVLRRRPRARQRRHRLGGGVGGEGGRLAGQGRRLDGDRPTARTAAALLPAPDQGRRTRTRGRPTTSATAGPTKRRPAQGHRPELPRARAPRGQARRRPAHPQHARASSTAASPSTRRNGRFWHRFDFDGYGEKKDGSRVGRRLARPTRPRTGRRTTTIGRIWPIFAGERGEYELAAGQSAAGARAARRDGARRRRRAT